MRKKTELDDNIWTEKYRPKDFSEVINLDSRIPNLVNNSMPHFLFHGNAGSGKTTVSRIIISKLGCDSLTLNASDERGIDTIREKVKTFAMTMSSARDMFKIVLLDEADYLTPEAQAILRNLTEKYHKNCRFILTCNFLNKIINPLQSRCAKFPFQKVSESEHLELLKKICDNEKVQYNEDVLKKIISVCKGDIRKSINILQQNVRDGKLGDSFASESNIKDIIEKIKKNQFDDVVRELVERNTDYDSLLFDFFDYIKLDKAIDLERRKKIILEIAQSMFEMSFVLLKDVTFSKFLIRLEGILK